MDRRTGRLKVLWTVLALGGMVLLIVETIWAFWLSLSYR